jgi:phosphoesterase RecJ-like protein
VEDKSNVFKRVVEIISKSENIVITSHQSPDGDSLGSSLGLSKFIHKQKKNVIICHPDKAPYFFNWITADTDIILFKENSQKVKEIISKADLIFSLDYNSYDRLGSEFGELVSHSSAEKIVIDHHQNPQILSEVSIIDTSIASTSELIFELIYQSGNLFHLDEEIAKFLYLGIMTDTGSFRFPSVSYRTHEILSELLRTGFSHSEIHERIYDSNTLERLKLKSFAIVNKLELLVEKPIGIITLTSGELRRFNYQKGDTEGLVNSILSIENIMVAAIFIEMEDGIKISFRSKGEYYVNELATLYFKGGGHKYAAGGFDDQSIDSAVSRFKEIVTSGFYNV